VHPLQLHHKAALLSTEVKLGGHSLMLTTQVH
jgi:hypothetical protein